MNDDDEIPQLTTLGKCCLVGLAVLIVVGAIGLSVVLLRSL